MNARILFSLIAILLALAAGTLAASASDDPVGRGPTPPLSPPQPMQKLPTTGSADMGEAQPFSPVGNGFTYQGSLKNNGSPANGQFDFQFKLYDALSGGTQVGNTLTVSNQAVTDGLFTVLLDFGASAFGGQARWLEIAVRQAGGGTYTTLAPRQPLSAVPYAQSLATGSSGAVITATLPGPALIVTNTNTIGLQGTGGTGSYGVRGYGGIGVYGITTVASGVGVRGDSQNGYGLHGTSGGSGIGVRGEGSSQHGGLFTNNSTTGYAALQGIASGTPGYGVYGEGNSIGVWGSTTNGTGVRGATTGGYGVHGYSVAGGTGVRGESPGGNGVYGLSTSGTSSGVYGENTATGGRGLWGVANTGSQAQGVRGESTTGVGVYGSSGSATNYGVYGITAAGNQGGAGVYGGATGTGGIGIEGHGGPGNEGTGVFGGGYYGVFAQGTNTGIVAWGGTSNAGFFGGDVYVTQDGTVAGDLYVLGSCCAAAAGTFQIDHPLDPQNKYLVQSAVQSADMVSIYSGNATTDAKGEAVVTLPSYVEALNKDFRYQVTIVGEQFAQARISSKIKDSRFTIKTDKPKIEVSWQVTGVRQDPYAKAHPIQAEIDKPADEQGLYRHPVEYGQPESKGTEYAKIEQMKPSQARQSNPAEPGR